jgi:LuxR family maltose regulon positive regulatory protein
MSAALLATKLVIPPLRPRERVVSRPRLIERLNEGRRLGCPLTLISAPAGFGKTTVITEWLHAHETKWPAAWLSLDEEDNDPARFFSYFIAAIETVHPEVGADALTLLQSPQPPALNSVLALLINSLANLLGDPRSPREQPLVLVLDDYHVIDDQAIHDALTFLLEHQPPHVHLIITSRVDPPLPLARLRARGHLNELRVADLRFAPDEAADFLTSAIGLSLSGEHIAALASRTEGCIAGLQLAALSMQDREDIPDFIAALTGSQHFILDYLVEEVLRRQPPAVQSFLLQTSILDRMSGPLCDAVMDQPPAAAVRQGEAGSGQETPTGLARRPGELGGSPAISSLGLLASSQEFLEYLDHANLFLVPLDDSRIWFRYHHLFSEFLRLRLRQIWPEHIPILHRRASQWYEDHALVGEAIDHALSAEDWHRAARLIEEIAEATLMRGEVATFVGWVEALPRDVLHARPRLDLYEAGMKLTGGRPVEESEAHSREVAAADMAAAPSQPAGQRLIEPLSQRELEVLGLIAAGLSNREIAEELVIAISTVKTHINNIYRKLDVSTRTQAVARAGRLKLV